MEIKLHMEGFCTLLVINLPTLDDCRNQTNGINMWSGERTKYKMGSILFKLSLNILHLYAFTTMNGNLKYQRRNFTFMTKK